MGGWALVVAVALGVAASRASAQPGAQPGARPSAATLAAAVGRANGRVIIGFKPAAGTAGVSAQGARLLGASQVQTLASGLSSLGVRVTKRLDLIPAVAATAPVAALDALLRNPNVAYVEPVLARGLALAPAAAPPRPAEAASEERVADGVPWGVEKIRAPIAWTLGGATNTGQGVDVGIIDSGGDATHPDLLYTDGYDFVTSSSATSAWTDGIRSCGGHGTHVAGTVAARRNNGVGVVGVAPDVRLHALKVFELDRDGTGACFAYTDVWIAALGWAVANGIEVVNMSFGGGGYSQAEADAIAAASNAGLVMVVAAGNDNGAVSYPAAYPGAIAVAAVEGNDARASFSNFGSALEVAAPGVSILSTVPAAINSGRYDLKSGTSMAAPHVTGLVALLLEANPTLGPAGVRAALRSGALDFGAPGRDILYGYGRVDAVASLGGGDPFVALAANTPVHNLSGDFWSSRYYTVNVPSGATRLAVTTAGGQGDVDLLVRRGTPPSGSPGGYDCLAEAIGNAETCTLSSPSPGTYFIQLFAFEFYDGLTLTASVSSAPMATQLAVTTQPAGAVSGVPFATQPVVQVEDGSGNAFAEAGVVISATIAAGPGVLRGTQTATTDATGKATFTDLSVIGAGDHTLTFTAAGLTAATSQTFTVAQPASIALTSGVPAGGLTMPVGTARYYAIDVPAGVTAVEIATAGGTGNVSLYVRAGQPPTLKTYDCRSASPGNAERCAISPAQPGTYEVMLYAVTAVTGASLTATLPTIAVTLGTTSTLTVAPGATFSIPVMVDMTKAQGLDLASVAFDVGWDARKLGFVSATPGAFGAVTLTPTPSATAADALHGAVSSGAGTTASFTAGTLTLRAGSAAGSAPISLVVTTAAGSSAQSLLGRVVTASLTVCIAGGLYGDVNNDGVVDVIDAQQIARWVVGLGVTDAVRLADAGDVTADGAVNVLDAQQIARSTVSLAAAARIGQAIPAGPCP